MTNPTMTPEPTTNYYELIEAFVEGYRGSRDTPGFEACVKAEINKRFAELHDIEWKYRELCK